MKCKVRRAYKAYEDKSDPLKFNVSFESLLPNGDLIGLTCLAGTVNPDNDTYYINKMAFFSTALFTDNSAEYSDIGGTHCMYSVFEDGIKCENIDDISIALAMLKIAATPMCVPVSMNLLPTVFDDCIIKSKFTGCLSKRYYSYANSGWKCIMGSLPKAFYKYILKRKDRNSANSQTAENMTCTNDNVQLEFGSYPTIAVKDTVSPLSDNCQLTIHGW